MKKKQQKRLKSAEKTEQDEVLVQAEGKKKQKHKKSAEAPAELQSSIGRYMNKD